MLLQLRAGGLHFMSFGIISKIISLLSDVKCSTNIFHAAHVSLSFLSPAKPKWQEMNARKTS